MPTMGTSKNHHRAYNRPNCSKKFWKAGEYDGSPCNTRRKSDSSSTSGFDHARMHPKFLHSNATSHKWVLGAFAELLDNALDEVRSGATYVNVDVLKNKKDGSKMIMVEDNGGGMDPEKMRKCMSLGYSEKSKMPNTIGQYGNGFKTSTMRLGADVIVFSRNEKTQSIGLLSYTFLRTTEKEDIVVPILDYERARGTEPWTKMIRSSRDNWYKSLDTVLEWSPYDNEKDLDRQFYMMKKHGTRIIIYNLWEDDEGNTELDLDSAPDDIQMRGVNRDEKNILMAETYPNSRHFLTYRHSLRSYASILYLRLPTNFRIILRGKDVEHHNILNDLRLSEQFTYRPKPLEKEEKRTRKEKRDTNMVAEVTLGFVKDAENHLDVQGFNVYHKNRLIKPFWRVWNAAGSDGRGVIGVVEADYINPAHDKQGFEHTSLLDRLRQKLMEKQKDFWSTNCHKIGYAPRRNKRAINEEIEAAKSSSQRPMSPSPSIPDFDSTRDESPSRKRPRLDSNLDEASSQKTPPQKLTTNVDKSPPQKCQKISSDRSPNGNRNVQKKCTVQTTTKPSSATVKPSSATVRPSSAIVRPASNNPNMGLAVSDKQANARSTARSAVSDSSSVEKRLSKETRAVTPLKSRGDNEENKLNEELQNASNTIQELRMQLKKANLLNMQLEKANEKILELTKEREEANEKVLKLAKEREEANEKILELTREREQANEKVSELTREREELLDIMVGELSELRSKGC